MKHGTLFQIEASDLIFISREKDGIKIKIEEIEIEMSRSTARILAELLTQAQQPEALSSY